MKLEFETIIYDAHKLKIGFGHEPDNLFIQYYMDEQERLSNQSADPGMGDFTSLAWKREARRITASPVTNFGIKTFPQFGAYGFYTPKYGDGTSRVIAPINPKRTTSQAPYVELEAVGNGEVLVKVKDPSRIQYDCFRIMFRQEWFADELITYDEEITVKVDPGTYDVTVIGYTDDGRHSIESRTTMKELTQPFAIPKTHVFIVSWSPDSKYLAIGCMSDEEQAQCGMMVYRVDEEAKRLVKLSDPGGNPIESVTELAWNEGSTMLSAKTIMGKVEFFNISTSSYSKTTSSFTTKYTNNRQIATSPNGLYVVYATKELLWYEVNANTEFVVI